MDLISREDAIRWVKTECNPYGKPTLDFESGKKVIEHLEQMPSAEPELATNLQQTCNQVATDCISRQDAINAFKKELTLGESKGNYVTICSAVGYEGARQILERLPSAQPEIKERTEEFAQNVPKEDLISRKAAIEAMSESLKRVFPEHRQIAKKCLKALPSAQPDVTGINVGDMVSRQAAIDVLDVLCQEHRYKIPGKIETYSQYNEAWQDALDRAEGAIFNLPSVQPERTCVNCGKTVNNGGWYADGRTRCPIEEHYALPKDGYCHLWEKRNVTDDDYPERREG